MVLLESKESNNMFATTDTDVDYAPMVGKKELQFNVRMAVEDFDLLQKAADILWPRAILSKSAIILGLAKIAAEDAVRSTRKRR
jgi:hypothetical protein